MCHRKCELLRSAALGLAGLVTTQTNYTYSNRNIMSTLALRIPLKSGGRLCKVVEVIDLTGDDDDCEVITCDDLYPPPCRGDEYRVERILDVYQPDDEDDVNVQYLVKWFGYPKSEATWEWVSNLSNSKDAIASFHARKH